jgi:hypothetical protein
MSKKIESAPRGKNLTPQGTMPPSMLKAHKLNADAVPETFLDVKELNGWAHRRTMKRLIQMVSLYRLTEHKVLRQHLARPLVNSLRYFADANKPEFRHRDKSAVVLDENVVVAS